MTHMDSVWRRLWAKIDKPDGEDGCWIWTGAKTSGGYGHFRLDGRTPHTHRWMYQQLVGPIPDGLVLDHLCRVRACCNPRHLEPVTILENLRRGQVNGNKTHCKRGHPFDEANTYHGVRSSGRRGVGNPIRLCRACHAACERRRQARLKQRAGTA